MPGASKTSARLSQYVDLAPWSYAWWWFILLAVHLVTGGYNAAFALFYYELEDTYLYRTLEYSGIGMLAKDHPTITGVNAVLAAMHGGCALLMIGASLWRRELSFTPIAPNSGMDSSTKTIVQSFDDRVSSRLESMKRQTAQVYSKVWGRRGLLGVNGRSFHSILIARELLETLLQTVQAYRMSWYLPRKKAEVEAKWSEFDRSTVVTLVVRHCTALEVPDSIADFHLTTGIKVYNSTINEWGASAAVTNTNHPALIWLYFVRVHLPDGRLPDGVMSSDFPSNLYDLEFTYTNVREVPDDLDTKWLIGTTVYFEYSELTSIPSVILRLDPYSISFTGSPISELSAEVFEVPDLVYMYLGSIAIQELPSNVTNLSPALGLLYLTDTNVSFFWPWIDPLVVKTQDWSFAPLLMGGSKYCAELEKITSEEAETFSVLPSSTYSTLMDASEGNRDHILHTVNCDMENAVPVYPIDFEDNVSGLQ
ncbi:hypothetical protein PC118_g20954 [Phytophthora cactorum]|uniref:Uncharacterized protein n=1 Tax=Phytophthora cactorum TaxID=29920 RepID=A0A8T1EW96_9STRA|nr:hypothetical protein PC118_g20954 [Phytophthora cactorum]